MDKFLGRMIFHVARILAAILLRVFYPMRVEGREELRALKAPFIAYGNHISGLDPIFMAYILLPNRTSFFAKDELLTGRFKVWALKHLGAIAVRRGTPDIQAVKEALSVLRRREVFAIFPEGTRNRLLDGELQEFRTGVGFIALKSRVPVIPIRMMNDGGFRIFRTARIRVGQPVSLEDLYETGKTTSETIGIAVSRMLQSMDELANT